MPQNLQLQCTLMLLALVNLYNYHLSLIDAHAKHDPDISVLAKDLRFIAKIK